MTRLILFLKTYRARRDERRKRKLEQRLFIAGNPRYTRKVFTDGIRIGKQIEPLKDSDEVKEMIGGY